MLVRMKVSMSGTRNGQDWPPRGSVLELPDAEGADYCRTGMAEPVAVFGTAKAETATVSVPAPELRDAEPETEPEAESTPPPVVRRGPGRPRKQP